ncbi:MAG: FHIPEP family type III secretion protein, partial [Deltaproteobacteria bacterium]|nr:FHIPEP family type III secretion protein [Deltaproteobacteria bacterium]
AIQQTEQGSFLAIEPDIAQKIMKNLAQNLEKFSSLNYQPIVLCSAQIRSHFKKLTDRFVPDLVVLSYNDILNNVQIQSLGTVGLSDAD